MLFEDFKMKKMILLLSVGLYIQGCSTGRQIASQEPGPSQQTSIELAKKLKGGNIKFVAQKANGGDSILQYLSLEFKDCKAELGDKLIIDGNPSNEVESYVVCDTNFRLGPFSGQVMAKVWGQKKQFSFDFSDNKDGRYDIQAAADLVWDGDRQRWSGVGKINGWYRSGKKDDGITITVREVIRL